jgi:FkbM family methyltransferase
MMNSKPIPGQAEIGSRKIHDKTIHYLREGSGWRFDTLMEKEPETIEWIDGFDPGEMLWDIGANVGIYSIYAALRGIKVLAFEPHFANYYQLCTNIVLNQLQDRITPLCIAFSAEKSVSTINLASLDFGTSMSCFGGDTDFRGNPFQPVFRQGMVGYDIDSFIKDFHLSVPAYFKIDVDGIELDIVRGAKTTFSQPNVKSISIELIDSDLKQVSTVTEVLSGAGLSFIHKKQNAEFATPQTRDVMNFLYEREEI